ncbi:MAG: quinone-dependent dihydroorotate dehydrogenase, partial [Steroidobacteraceae bacterium]
AGGLSGAPLLETATATVRKVRAQLRPAIALIGVGGIRSPADARAMLAAGADLIQLYTGLVYQGPRLVRELAQL